MIVLIVIVITIIIITIRITIIVIRGPLGPRRCEIVASTFARRSQG